VYTHSHNTHRHNDFVSRETFGREQKAFFFCSVFYLLSPNEVNGITSRRHKHDLKGINYAYLSWVSLYECKQYPSSHFKMSVDVSIKTQSKVLVNKEIIWQTDSTLRFLLRLYLVPRCTAWWSSLVKGGECRLIRVDSTLKGWESISFLVLQKIMLVRVLQTPFSTILLWPLNDEPKCA
jgi:hypothetical protein